MGELKKIIESLTDKCVDGLKKIINNLTDECMQHNELEKLD